MVRLIPPTQKGPVPCAVCGRLDHREHAETLVLKVFAPTYVDQRIPWRFRSTRNVLRRLSHGRFEKVWAKGAVIPPEEAVRQGIVTMDQLAPRERARVESVLAAGKNRGA